MPNTVINGTIGNDYIIDNARDIIYISTDTSGILRYDLNTQSFLTSIEVSDNLQGLSLSQDGNTLVVAGILLVTTRQGNFTQLI